MKVSNGEIGQNPLIVDLDGTLYPHDSAQLQLTYALFRDPQIASLAVWELFRGRAASAKALLANRVPAPDFSNMAPNHSIVEYLKVEKAKGRYLILCSGANEIVANSASTAIGLFDEVWASNQWKNLTGKNKLEVIQERLNFGKFEYLGNSVSDKPIFEQSEKYLKVTNPRYEAEGRVTAWIRSLIKLLRFRHWTKNLLVFLPLITALPLTTPQIWVDAFVFFVLISLLASATYILNDLHDLYSDIRHLEKRNRPIAAGFIQPIFAMFLALILLTLAFSISLLIGKLVITLTLLTYLVATSIYSLGLKRSIGGDVVGLAFLYSLRVAGSMIVTGLPFSTWLLSFVFFLFLSMSLAKRLAELHMTEGQEYIPGRSYRLEDKPIVTAAGVASSVASVVLLITYISELDSPKTLGIHLIALTIVPILSWWQLRLWLQASRGLVNSDPVDWALQDKLTIFAAFSIFALFMFSRL